jgi:hypothetical protein
MTQGIRMFVNAKFAELLPQLDTMGGTAFRKAIMQAAVEQFGIGVPSAATHYNHALKQQREVDPASVRGLGRPEDKKGGRKPIHVVDVIKVKTGEVVAAGVSKGAANVLIARAERARKAKLAIRVDEPAAEVAPAEAVPA